MKRGKRKLIIFISMCLAAALFIYTQNNWIQIVQYTIASSKVPQGFDGYKILQLSDLHSKRFGKDNKALISRINKINPDIIVVTGDMINSLNDAGEVFLNLAEQLSGQYRIYHIVGNHEQIAQWKAKENKSGWYGHYINELEKLGVVVLNDSKADIGRDGSKISLYGLEVPLPYYKAKDTPSYIGEKPYGSANVQKSLGEPEPKSFNILLTHNPMYFSAYREWGADLVLAGHMHGGIIRIPFKGGLLSPERAFFPQYDAGRFTEGESTMIVNRGLGNDSISIRIFNRPELSVITLKSK
jgi:uncharacterized protein